ncbi:hypothetical protein DCC85_04945 [Paenibacillus sp. CAA11]|uniref:hypothetical protein n=1 Tax=Paenibacillus sp. CAA11 TaxID=1532905 RepID=UPI000D3404BF|nr:hypothetical protein [Paenibacillus sp. CAA11]AWB43634.1 hypothetical protein DCC85_04945 [Paenibacillus sp. CAA11]
MHTTYEDLMEQAYSLPDGRAKVEVLEEAIRVADSMGDIDLGYEARSELVETATFHGYPMKALVAFSWQLGQFDKDPERFDDYSLFWSYKWMLDQVPSFPDISRTQIENLLEDMRNRYREYGYSDRTYYYYRFVLGMKYGEAKAAEPYLKKFQEMEPDDMSNCQACEQDQLVEFQTMLGNYEEALRLAKPILKGRMTCGEVPHVTLAYLLKPLYDLGRLEEAKEYHLKGYRLIKGQRDFPEQFGQHIGYLTLVDPIRALEVFEECVGLTLNHENPHDKMIFDAYAAGLFKRLSQENVKFQVKLPVEYPHPEEATDVVRLSMRFGEMAMDTAQRLDQRNGNSYHTNRVKDIIG